MSGLKELTFLCNLIAFACAGGTQLVKLLGSTMVFVMCVFEFRQLRSSKRSDIANANNANNNNADQNTVQKQRPVCMYTSVSYAIGLFLLFCAKLPRLTR